jgi:hypothetical protein
LRVQQRRLAVSHYLPFTVTKVTFYLLAKKIRS